MASERSDLGRISSVFQRFHPRARLAQGTIGFLSFLGGLSEAAVLVLITSVAVATTKSHQRVDLGPTDFTVRQILGMAMVLIVANVAMAAATAGAVGGGRGLWGLKDPHHHQ
jgi:hypothetical protein